MPRQTAAERAAAEADRQRIEAEAQAEIAEDHGDPDAEPQAEGDAGGEPTVRETDMAWWCPLCGHSQTKLITTCAGCGQYDYEGETP